MRYTTASGAAGKTALIFGVLAGIGGLTHGIGEVLQGNVPSEGIIIDSWTQGPIATHMGGEPGMTVVPNLLVTGALAILVSLALVIKAILVRNKRDGRALLLLSILLLLVGGGFGPPIMGILAGVAGTGIEASSTWWRARRAARVWRFTAPLWPWIFAIAVINGLFLVIGSLILIYVFDVNNPDLFVNSFFFAVVSLLVTIFVGRAYDAQQHEQRVVT